MVLRYFCYGLSLKGGTAFPGRADAMVFGNHLETGMLWLDRTGLLSKSTA